MKFKRQGPSQSKYKSVRNNFKWQLEAWLKKKKEKKRLKLAGISRIKEPRTKMKELIKFESRINSIKGLIEEKN
jgi:hypothetical protein